MPVQNQTVGFKAPRPHRPPFTPRSWDQLSRDEQRRQIRDLIASAYWVVLPRDIQERFLDLYRNS